MKQYFSSPRALQKILARIIIYPAACSPWRNGNERNTAEERRNDEILRLRRFEGEDRNLGERLKAQREQMRWWIQRQKEEREAAEKARRDAEDAYQEVVLSRDKRATTLAQMEEECRRRLNEATATFNRALVQVPLYLRL